MEKGRKGQLFSSSLQEQPAVNFTSASRWLQPMSGGHSPCFIDVKDGRGGEEAKGFIPPGWNH